MHPTWRMAEFGRLRSESFGGQGMRLPSASLPRAGRHRTKSDALTLAFRIDGEGRLGMMPVNSSGGGNVKGIDR